jgi:hypothetical protein
MSMTATLADRRRAAVELAHYLASHAADPKGPISTVLP